MREQLFVAEVLSGAWSHEKEAMKYRTSIVNDVDIALAGIFPFSLCEECGWLANNSVTCRFT